MMRDRARIDGSRLARRIHVPLALAATLVWLAPLSTTAQQPAQCATGEAAALISLGISRLDCDCILDAATGELRFRSSPSVSGVLRGGPADGRLQDGDVILAVGGASVTNTTGARRLQATRFDEPVELRIRRNGQVRSVMIRPESCRLAAAPTPPSPPSADQARLRDERPDVAVRSAPTPPAAVGRAGRVQAPTVDTRIRSAPRPPAAVGRAGRGQAPTVDTRIRSAPTPPAAVGRAGRGQAPPAAVQSAPTPPAASLRAPQIQTQDWRPPDAWLGIGLQCTDCSLQTFSDGRIRWSFTDEPVVMSVEPNSPAQRAGLSPGDVLTHINGTTITSSAGEREFSQIQPGESVRLTYVRNRRRATATLVAAERPASSSRAAEAEQRYIDMIQEEQQRLQQIATQARQADTTRANAARSLEERRTQSVSLEQAIQASRAQAAAQEARQRASQIDPEVYEQLVRELVEMQTAAQQTASRAGAQEEEVAAIARQFRELQDALERQQRELEARLEAQDRERGAAASVPSGNDPVRFSGRVGGADVEVRGTSNVITRVMRNGDEIVIVTPDGEIRIRRVGGGS